MWGLSKKCCVQSDRTVKTAESSLAVGDRIAPSAPQHQVRASGGFTALMRRSRLAVARVNTVQKAAQPSTSALGAIFVPHHLARNHV
jgi:hypothetical protein